MTLDPLIPSKLGAEVRLEEAMVMGLGALTSPLGLSLSSGPKSLLLSKKLFLLFLLLRVDTPESFELSVEDGKSELVSRKPGQI